MSLSRREFIGIGSAAVAGMALAPGLRLVELAQARSPDEAVTSLQRWGLLVDISKCHDCDACVTACHEENGVQSHGRPATDAQWIRKVTLKDKQTGYVQTLPVMCQHCEHRRAWTSAPPAPRSSAPTASCWWTSTSASAAATA